MAIQTEKEPLLEYHRAMLNAAREYVEATGHAMPMVEWMPIKEAMPAIVAAFVVIAVVGACFGYLLGWQRRDAMLDKTWRSHELDKNWVFGEVKNR